jgi:uncharacterized membrane protein
MTFTPYLLLIFAFVGIAIAFYDSFMVYSGGLLWCPPPVDGCNTVAYSPYARLFNVPLGYLGLVFYLSMFALAALLAYDPASHGLRLGAFLLAALGVFFSLCFQYIELTFIHAFCVYCLVSFILTLLLFMYALVYFRGTRRQAHQEGKLYAPNSI